MVVVGQLELRCFGGQGKEFGRTVVLWRKPVMQLRKPRSNGKSLGTFYIVERQEKHTGGTLSVCRKSRECLAVAREADGEAGRADGGSKGEQSEFQV